MLNYSEKSFVVGSLPSNGAPLTLGLMVRRYDKKVAGYYVKTVFVLLYRDTHTHTLIKRTM